jgi:hypothetical protein
MRAGMKRVCTLFGQQSDLRSRFTTGKAMMAVINLLWLWEITRRFFDKELTFIKLKNPAIASKKLELSWDGGGGGVGMKVGRLRRQRHSRGASYACADNGDSLVTPMVAAITNKEAR